MEIWALSRKFLKTEIYGVFLLSSAKHLTQINIWTYLLKCERKKNDQNLNNVFISCDKPTPNFFRSKKEFITQQNRLISVFRTVE